MAETEHFDIVVVGGGKAGKSLAMLRAGLGDSVLMVERDKVGGTCINVACIPTKTLVTSARRLDEVRTAAGYGVAVDGADLADARIDLDALRARKEGVVGAMVAAHERMFDAPGLDFVRGTARFTGPKTVEIALDGGGVRTVEGRDELGGRGGLDRERQRRGARPGDDRGLARIADEGDDFVAARREDGREKESHLAVAADDDDAGHAELLTVGFHDHPPAGATALSARRTLPRCDNGGMAYENEEAPSAGEAPASRRPGAGVDPRPVRAVERTPSERYPVPVGRPRYASAPRKVSGRRRTPVWDAVASVFVVVALALVLWFAGEILMRGRPGDPAWGAYLVVFWGLVAYLALPRIHQLFTVLYVPDYFIGRTRTGDGILGDPVNLAFDGAPEDVHAAMQAAGWTLADDVTLRSSWRIVKSSLLRRSYQNAPVSDLFLFGRRQSFAYQQEVDGHPSQRHHVRFWPTPEGWRLPGGQRVDFLAAGTYDRSVGLSSFTGQITHRIDADTDAERDYVVDTLRYADHGVDVRVIDGFSTAYHSRSGGGDAIETDGDLPVVDVSDAAERNPEPEAPAAETGLARHHVPPTPLLVTGMLSAGGLLLQAGFVFAGRTPATALLTSGLNAALFLLTAARFRWAWVGLMAVSSSTCAMRLALVGGAESEAFVDAGFSVLVVLAVSSSSVRAWVRE